MFTLIHKHFCSNAMLHFGNFNCSHIVNLDCEIIGSFGSPFLRIVVLIFDSLKSEDLA